MRTIDLNCWRCGQRETEIPLPVPRAHVCDACNADLHVCRQCRFFDAGQAHQCREPVADPVSEKTRANFCGYFEAATELVVVESSEDRSELHALFGLDASAQDQSNDPQDALLALFNNTQPKQS